VIPAGSIRFPVEWEVFDWGPGNTTCRAETQPRVVIKAAVWKTVTLSDLGRMFCNGLRNRCRWLDHIGPVSNGLGNLYGFHTRCFETVCGPWDCIVSVDDFMDGRLSPTLEPRSNETS
jgi:hypothetical protein